MVNHKQLSGILLLLVIMALWFFYQDKLSLYAIQQAAFDMLRYVEKFPFRSLFIFSAFYFLICALPTPFISVPTMLAGYLFGNMYGLLLVSFLSALGNTVLFLGTCYFLQNWVRKNLSQYFPSLNKVIASDSFAAALSLRLIPGMPFSIPAMILGLSQLSVMKFYLSTQLGLLATLFVYVNAGQSLAQLTTIDDIFNIQFLAALLLLALIPLLFAFIFKRNYLQTHLLQPQSTSKQSTQLAE